MKWLKASRRSLLAVVGVSIVVAFSTYNYIVSNQALRDDYALFVVNREKHVQNYVSIAKNLGAAGYYQELNEILEQARQNHYIDFYIVQKSGDALFWGTPSGKPDSVNVKYTKIEVPIVTEDLSLLTGVIDESTLVTVGINKNPDVYVSAALKRYKYSLLQETAAFVLLGFLIFFYYSRDFRKILHSFGSRNKELFRNVKSNFKEYDIFIRGLQGYEDVYKNLSGQHSALDAQVLPALKNELFSGKSPPYEFMCTLVRTDINNFSTMFNSDHSKEFLETVNAFFTEVSHIVSTYGGWIYEFIGDEVIFYFKDEDVDDSFLTALSAVRDISKAATRVSQATSKTFHFPFTVKSSLSYGEIQFGHLVKGYSITGSVLIETVRMLAQVSDRSDNVVLIDEKDIGRLGELFEVSKFTETVLKGFEGKRVIYSVSARVSTQKVLEGLNEGSIWRLNYFRSSGDVLLFIEALKERRCRLSFESQLRVIGLLRLIKLTRNGGEISKGLSSWVLEELESPSFQEPEKSNMVLASVAMLFINLVPKEDFDAGAEEALVKLLLSSDSRVAANAMDVLTHFHSEMRRRISAFLFESVSSRYVANAIVYDGSKFLKPSTIKRLKRMLKSKVPGVRASGLFALGELSRIYRTKDPIQFNTHMGLQSLVDEIPAFASEKNSTVRRQALIASFKAGNDTIVKEAENRLHSYSADGGDPYLGEAGVKTVRLKKAAGS